MDVRERGEYRDSLGAFDRDSFGEEPAPQCEIADFESTDLELLEEVEVPVMFSMDFLER